MTSGEPIVDRLLVGRAIVNPLGLSPRQYVARKARDCRRRARELRLQLKILCIFLLFGVCTVCVPWAKILWKLSLCVPFISEIEVLLASFGKNFVGSG